MSKLRKRPKYDNKYEFILWQKLACIYCSIWRFGLQSTIKWRKNVATKLFTNNRAWPLWRKQKTVTWVVLTLAYSRDCLVKCVQHPHQKSVLRQRLRTCRHFPVLQGDLDGRCQEHGPEHRVWQLHSGVGILNKFSVHSQLVAIGPSRQCRDPVLTAIGHQGRRCSALNLPSPYGALVCSGD